MSNFRYGGNVFANEIRQHYLRFGKQSLTGYNTPIILIPGITSPAMTWGFVAERLGEFFDVYVLDVRGRGLSQADENMDYSLDAQARDVLAFAKALKLDRYSLIGHSMGARIAIRLMRFDSECVVSAVLVDPPVSGPGRRPYPMALDWYLDSIRSAKKGIDAEAMRAYSPTWTLEQLRVRAEWLHTCNESAIAASFEGFSTDDIHADLLYIKVPTLLITAQNADVVREEDVTELQQLMPHLEHKRVPNAGHMIPWDNEKGFYEALDDFLGT